MAVRGETFVGRGIESRTFLYFRVPGPALRQFVPEGFEVRPPGSGPGAGANLLAAFVDQSTALDAGGEPQDTMRYVLFEIPVRAPDTDAAAWLLVAGLSTGGAGVYGTNSEAEARVERRIRHDGAGTAIEEAWDFEAGGGERVSLRLRFSRGPVSVGEVESRVYSQVRPRFYRIYRVEQAVDVVRPPAGASRPAEVAFEAAGGRLAQLFEGAVHPFAVVSVPVYARRIFLP
ncbi:MAG: hypothetical protein IT529_19195 [Burkholderiales bacterium]|nr:hypothetical protein [Burkholderiales bacterium]